MSTSIIASLDLGEEELVVEEEEEDEEEEEEEEKTPKDKGMGKDRRRRGCAREARGEQSIVLLSMSYVA